MDNDFEQSINKTRNCISLIFNWFYVWKTLQNNNYNKIYNKDKYFWTAVIYSLRDNFLIELAKIFEKTKKYNILSIHYLLDLIPKGEEREDIEKEISNYKPTIDNLIKWRGNLLAHRNKYFALNSNELSKRFPIKNDEIEKLINLLEKMLGKIDSLRTKKGIVYTFSLIKEESQKDTENIIKNLELAYKVKKEQFEEELKKYHGLYGKK